LFEDEGRLRFLYFVKLLLPETSSVLLSTEMARFNKAMTIDEKLFLSSLEFNLPARDYMHIHPPQFTFKT
jgi:hypothetical protein